MKNQLPYFLHLADEALLFRGTTRRVYRHPHDASLLVKVPSQAEEQRRAANRPQWKRRFKPTGIANITNLREMAEMLRLNPDAAPCLPHLYRFVGMAATNHGWGQIVQAEYDGNGGYAPTLEQIAAETSLYEKPLEAFIRWARQTDTVFIDLEPWNCVLAERGGKKQIVVIDGIGEKTVIPFRHYFSRLNSRKNQKQIQQFFNSLELVKQGKAPPRRRA